MMMAKVRSIVVLNTSRGALAWTQAKMISAFYKQVYCVQMTLALGYDILFQDVDIVWYKNPVPFFQDKSSPMQSFDVIFQDDGSRALFYSPYSANTGNYCSSV